MKVTTKTTLPRIKHPKRLIIIITASLVLAGLITYGVFSYLTWKGLADDSQKVSATFKQSIDSRLGAETPSGTPLENVNAIITNFDTAYGDQPCAVSPLFSWQTVLPAASDIKANCEAGFAKSLAVVADLKNLSSFYVNEKVVSDLLLGVTESTKATTDYTAAAAEWQIVTASPKLNISDDFKAITDKTKETSAAIAVAFTTVKAGVDSENRTTFDTAITDLQTAYTNLVTVQSLINEHRTALIIIFTKSYEKL